MVVEILWSRRVSWVIGRVGEVEGRKESSWEGE